jgi:hypothetical protein
LRELKEAEPVGSRRSVASRPINATLKTSLKRVSILKFNDILSPRKLIQSFCVVSSAWWYVSTSMLVTALLLHQPIHAQPHLPLRYPLSAPPSLSSSFGTYRINHHHAGLDLYGLEGTPVKAAAAGYISLIKRGSGGYGRAIYLKHPGHFITLYAHMSAFAPKVKALIEASRHPERFEQKLRPRERVFVEAGEVIGYLGTSGTDLMHLHFELRYRNQPINPLTHGLTLPDTQAPTLIKLFAVPFEHGAYVNGDVAPFEVSFQPRPERVEQPATAIFSTEPKNEPKAEPKAEPRAVSLETWGDVRLSLEVEDRVDGSARELTPYELTLEIDGKLVHHLRYDKTSYSDKRASELDFDLERRGPERALVHRLYRVGPRHKPLKRGSASPLKRLKQGVHKAKITAKDAAGNVSHAELTLNVKRPPSLPCGLKHKRLASPRLRQPKGAQPLDLKGASWRPYGLTVPLSQLGVGEFSCEEGRELQVDVRWSGERARRSTVSLVKLNGELALSFDLHKLKFGAEGRD